MYLYAFEKHIYIDFTHSDYLFFSQEFLCQMLGMAMIFFFFLIIKTEEVLNEKKKRENGQEGF